MGEEKIQLDSNEVNDSKDTSHSSNCDHHFNNNNNNNHNQEGNIILPYSLH